VNTAAPPETAYVLFIRSINPLTVEQEQALHQGLLAATRQYLHDMYIEFTVYPPGSWERASAV
jgi:hypothetical protein